MILFGFCPKYRWIFCLCQVLTWAKKRQFYVYNNQLKYERNGDCFSVFLELLVLKPRDYLLYIWTTFFGITTTNKIFSLDASRNLDSSPEIKMHASATKRILIQQTIENLGINTVPRTLPQPKYMYISLSINNVYPLICGYICLFYTKNAYLQFVILVSSAVASQALHECASTLIPTSRYIISKYII